MPTIAMTREMGSLGKDVAAGVADKLGLRVIYHEVVDTLANELHVDRSAVTRLLDGSATVSDRWKVDTSEMALFTAEQIFDIALAGNAVIRGWGATSLLRPVPHIPCIRVSAPLPVRMRHLMARLHTDDQDRAMREIQRSDAAHAATVRRLFGDNYEDPWLYDVTLNTERDSVDFCIEEIVTMVSHANFSETPESRRLLQNMAMTARVRAILRRTSSTAKVNITVNVSDDRLTLEGIVDTKRQRDEVEAVASGVAGVARVENHLKQMTSTRHLAAGPSC